MTKLEAEDKAINDFRSMCGKVIYVKAIYGYVGDDSHDVYIEDGDPWILVRITSTDESDVCHWNDEWLDPYWNVELLIEDHPAIPEGFRSTWIHGKSYREGTEETDSLVAHLPARGDRLVL
jgi:hypothetical protein